MSFSRYVYYCALAGGWGAFVGWGLIELTGSGGTATLVGAAFLGAILGAMICGGLAAFNTLLNSSITQVPRKVGLALVGGMIGGGIATIVAQLLFQFGMPRFLAWMLMGIGIGLVEGFFEQSPTKLRNGIIGGAVGGALGGLLFDPIVALVGSDVPSRAIGFVIVGLFIGALIGLVQVILKQAWLVVVDGYRPGRQLILSTPTTMLGRGDHLPLPFLGLSNADIEQEHVRVVRQSGGGYMVEDNNSRLGTFLNGQPISGPTPLKHKDRIRFGTNHVEFNESRSSGSGGPTPGPTPVTAATPARVPLPPPNMSLKPRVAPPPSNPSPPPVEPVKAPQVETARPVEAGLAGPSKPAVPPPPSRPGSPPPPPPPGVSRPGMPPMPSGAAKPPPPPPVGGVRPPPPPPAGGPKPPPPPPRPPGPPPK